MDLSYLVEAIKFRMEQHGLRPKNLEPLIGKRLASSSKKNVLTKTIH